MNSTQNEELPTLLQSQAGNQNSVLTVNGQAIFSPGYT